MGNDHLRCARRADLPGDRRGDFDGADLLAPLQGRLSLAVAEPGEVSKNASTAI